MAPGTAFGPVETLDLRAPEPDADSVGDAILAIRATRSRQVSAVAQRALSADRAERSGVIDLIALQLPEVLRELDGRTIEVAGRQATLDTDPEGLAVRFRKTDLVGRVQHAVAQPSIAYLLLLLGLVGLVFELFHPSTGPAGGTGLAGLALGLYGIGVLGGSWLAVALIIVGVAGFCVDLRVEGLGLFTLTGLAMLIAGSLLLFPGPFLKVHPLVLGFGIAGMIAFLVSAMTRVLRDLRALARGEIEVTDPHPH
jgi:membrane-bound serine protease (ClpP class)